jgi:dihydroorotase
VTARPAAFLGLDGEIGTLRPGAVADAAIVRLAEGSFPLIDVHGAARTAGRRIEHVRTIVAGRPLETRPLPALPPWIRRVDAEARS